MSSASTCSSRTIAPTDESPASDVVRPILAAPGLCRSNCGAGNLACSRLSSRPVPDLMARRIESLFVAGPVGKLECLLEEPEDQHPREAVLVCHPTAQP